jgi:hypothetical protein
MTASPESSRVVARGMTLPLVTYLWLVCVPFPSGAVGERSVLTQGAS